MPNPLRVPLWQSMLDADMNTRYWGYVGRKYSSREKYIKIFLAVFSSTSAVGSWSLWQQNPEVWKLMISVSAVVAIALPILDFSGLIEKAVDQKGKWTRFLSQLEVLWAKIEEDPSLDVESEFGHVQDAVAQTSKGDATIPLDEKLRQRSYGEVFAVRKS